ncbi:hypothetical protein IAD21_03253 [Abditibacteriota bacterium]|nr:hypothetical protein IAD21_03253 [Abditibacteriota bacterium]
MNQSLLDSKQKVPFVCFDCRISVKIPLPSYYEEIGDKNCAQRTNTQCPRCKKPMAYLGRYFKIPPKNALTQWRKAELLWRNGWSADGYSDSPKTLREAREFIQKPDMTTTRRALKRRAENEERWRRLRAKRDRLLRHKNS